MISPTLYSSGDLGGSYEWNTPKELFLKYDAIHHYEVDLAATYLNALCPEYLGPCEIVYYEYCRLVALSKSDDKVVRKEYRHAAQEFLERMGRSALDHPVAWASCWRKGWCNCPYGNLIPQFVLEVYRNVKGGMELVTMLLPARTDTQWFHTYIYANEGRSSGVSTEIELLKGRVKYELHGKVLDPAPFPSMIVHFTWKGERE